jgi:hypothetical protein
MSSLTPNEIVDLTEILVVLMGIGIIWAVYHGSERAELPGEARIPDPRQADDTRPDTTGRTL